MSGTFGLPPPRTTGPLWKKLEARERAIAIGEYPTTRQIAVAIISACRLVGGDPEACALGRYHIEGRGLAYAALQQLFPKATGEYLATVLGRRKEKQTIAFVKKMARSVGYVWWWTDGNLTAVVTSIREDRLLPPGATLNPSRP